MTSSKTDIEPAPAPKVDAKAVFDRWRAGISRDLDRDAPDEWFQQQCLHCAHYVPLSGELGEDYGACTNAASKNDRNVMYEHDGCDRFEALE